MWLKRWWSALVSGLRKPDRSEQHDATFEASSSSYESLFHRLKAEAERYVEGEIDHAVLVRRPKE
jgi:hypothetical protein